MEVEWIRGKMAAITGPPTSSAGQPGWGISLSPLLCMHEHTHTHTNTHTQIILYSTPFS